MLQLNDNYRSVVCFLLITKFIDLFPCERQSIKSEKNSKYINEFKYDRDLYFLVSVISHVYFIKQLKKFHISSLTVQQTLAQ